MDKSLIDALKAHVRELRGRAEDLNAKIRAAEMTIRSLEENQRPIEPTPSAPVEVSVSMKPQQAVERFLHDNPGAWFRAGRIKTHLMASGAPKSKNLIAAIISALNRAVDKGIAEQKLSAKGRKLYALKADTPEVKS